ncbi:MAG: putative DNA binding domain-containing protein [Candidatus Omnitrophica bacterium]|nr:putative DNA binding domain-containing protein [Candidatus Omnitrophota bacterium]
MTKTELKGLIKESENIELKLSLSLINEIIEAISAFANARGGKIVVGVDSGGRIIGIQIGKDTIESLTNRIAQNTDPKIHPRISVKDIEGKKIVVIEIKESLDRLILAFGRPFKRVGKSTMRIGKDEYERLILEKHKDKLQFDSQICKEANLSKDIDQRKVKTYLKLREKNRKISSKIKIPINQLLININAVIDKKPTNAGILFFGKNPLRFISHAQLRLVRIKGVKIYGNILDRLDCDGTLWEMVDQVEDFLRKNIRLLGFRTDQSFHREDRFEYPIRALREAIINGLIHRDYFNLADVRVFIFDDRIEIVSPGPFPEGVTPKKPRHKPVNKILSDLMYDIGYIEKYGSGIYLENELCLRNKNPKPVYEIDPIQTKVIFKSQVKDVTVVEIEEKILGELNERQKKAIEYVRKNGKIVRKEYEKLCKTSERTANRELTELIKKGIIKKIGSGVKFYYELAS